MNQNPTPQNAPGDTPSPTVPGSPRQAPGAPARPDVIEAPSPERETTLDSDDAAGTIGVDTEEAHVGATEEQIGDRTGPGAGYDQKRR